MKEFNNLTRPVFITLTFNFLFQFSLLFPPKALRLWFTGSSWVSSYKQGERDNWEAENDPAKDSQAPVGGEVGGRGAGRAGKEFVGPGRGALPSN